MNVDDDRSLHFMMHIAAMAGTFGPWLPYEPTGADQCHGCRRNELKNQGSPWPVWTRKRIGFSFVLACSPPCAARIDKR